MKIMQAIVHSLIENLLIAEYLDNKYMSFFEFRISLLMNSKLSNP